MESNLTAKVQKIIELCKKNDFFYSKIWSIEKKAVLLQPVLRKTEV